MGRHTAARGDVPGTGRSCLSVCAAAGGGPAQRTATERWVEWTRREHDKGAELARRMRAFGWCRIGAIFGCAFIDAAAVPAPASASRVSRPCDAGNQSREKGCWRSAYLRFGRSIPAGPAPSLASIVALPRDRWSASYTFRHAWESASSGKHTHALKASSLDLAFAHSLRHACCIVLDTLPARFPA